MFGLARATLSTIYSLQFFQFKNKVYRKTELSWLVDLEVDIYAKRSVLQLNQFQSASACQSVRNLTQVNNGTRLTVTKFLWIPRYTTVWSHIFCLPFIEWLPAGQNFSEQTTTIFYNLKMNWTGNEHKICNNHRKKLTASVLLHRNDGHGTMRANSFSC